MSLRAAGACCGAVMVFPVSSRPVLLLVLVASVAALADAPDGGSFPVTFGGYVEADYQYNFNVPSNGLTNFRVVDNRHNSFTVPNVSLNASLDTSNVVARVALQVGHMPDTYYAAEPTLPGAAGANATGPSLWKYVQEAFAGYRFPVLEGLLVRAGIFLSPIGPEAVPIRENWNWSRSNLFVGLPFYHAGVEASLKPGGGWTLTAGGYNGWNSVVDNNDEKSLALQAFLERSGLEVSLIYFTGVERPRGAPEGRPWRHLFDANVTWHVSERVSLLGHVNAGFESNRFGVSAWGAGALYARVRLHELVFAAVRGDVFVEHVPSGAAPIAWPVPWVSSGTATLDFRPHEHVSFRLEYRHDHAGAPIFFGGTVEGDGVGVPYVPNRVAQDTVTVGALAWF